MRACRYQLSKSELETVARMYREGALYTDIGQHFGWDENKTTSAISRCFKKRFLNPTERRTRRGSYGKLRRRRNVAKVAVTTKQQQPAPSTALLVKTIEAELRKFSPVGKFAWELLKAELL